MRADPLIPPVAEDQASEKVAQTFGRLREMLGDERIPGPFLIYANVPAFLQDFYRRINTEGHTRAAVTCPSCAHRFAVDLSGGRLGES